LDIQTLRRDLAEAQAKGEFFSVYHNRF